MKNIEVKKIIQAIETSDGAGVKLKRSIGTPEANYIDPFLMLDEFGSENKDDYIAGFPPHPHRGIETVTYMLKGDFEHEDSTGAKGIMSSGDVQWMKTGRGIIHSEMPAMSDGKLLGFQLWVNMPAKLKKNKPEYIYIKGNELGTHEDNEKVVKVIAGKYKEVEGPEKNHNVEPIYFHIVLNEGKEFSYEVPEGHNSFIYLLKGELKIGEKDHTKTVNSNLILLERGNKLIAKAYKTTEFLFIAGKPIGEPIARGGPFVMNTKAEVLEAIQDYNNGTFAKY
jgi:quercetin 2,3-dioxygenase